MKKSTIALLLLLPLLIAIFEVGLLGALCLVLLILVFQWLQTLQGLTSTPQTPSMVLESIPPSHFVEKVRWCLDRLGVEYQEQPALGVLGVLTTGRTVPVLRFRTGLVESSIGNSSEILRFLYGAQCTDERAEFLRPTPERIALEADLDRYGADLQRWVYFHIIDERDVVLHAWGTHDERVPAWQRNLAPILYPLSRTLIRRAFRISPKGYKRSVEAIEELLQRVEARINEHGSPSGERELNYVDITFCALSALWAWPDEFAGDGAAAVRPDESLQPAAMATDIDRWRTRFPACTTFIESTYSKHRNR